MCQVFRENKRRKAPGPDGVTPVCLKSCADHLASIFTQIFNRSLELCEVPSCFKAQQRLYFLRQLRKFNLPQELLIQFYSAVIESVLCMSITVWFSSATKSELRRLRRVVRTAEWIIGTTFPTLSRNCTYPEWAKGLAKSLWTPHIQPLKSGPLTSSTLPLWTVTVWSTLQSSEHQNDQTQKQFLSPSNPSHEHLILNMEHTTLLCSYLFTTHTYCFIFKFAHVRLHSYLPVLYIVFLLFCTSPICILFFYYLSFPVAFILLHCGASVTITKYCVNIPGQ